MSSKFDDRPRMQQEEIFPIGDHFYGASLANLLDEIVYLKNRILEECLKGENLTGAQAKVIMALIPKSTSTLTNLSRHLGTDTGSMSRMIERLEFKGFIIRNQDHQDRRQIIISLTTEGRSLAERLPSKVAIAMSDLTHSLSLAQAKTLESILILMVQ